MVSFGCPGNTGTDTNYGDHVNKYRLTHMIMRMVESALDGIDVLIAIWNFQNIPSTRSGRSSGSDLQRQKDGGLRTAF